MENPGNKAKEMETNGTKGGGSLPDPKIDWFHKGMILFVGIVVCVLFYKIVDSPTLLDKLTDPAIARGLITFSITVATIALAFTLVYQAFYAVESSDDRFRRGREVFTGLMGILGTVVGFYFGSAEQSTTKLEITEIKIENQTLRTHVIGGTPPFKYSILSDDKSLEIKNKPSDDGWIDEKLAKVPNEGKITVEVTDIKNKKATRDYKLEKPNLPPAGNQNEVK